MALPAPVSSYWGARKRKWGRWVSEIRDPGKKARIWLGSYEAPEMAAAAYDVAYTHCRGPLARLSFPEILGALLRPASSQAEDIQFAVQQAAIMFRRPLTSSSDQKPIGQGGSMVLATTVGLAPTTSQNEAINESPMDSPKMWMQMAQAFMLEFYESVALYNDEDNGLDLRRWEEILNDPLWDF